MPKDGNVTLPNWNPKEHLDAPKSLPKSNEAGKIPPHTTIKPFAGLPASTMPRPLKIEGH